MVPPLGIPGALLLTPEILPMSDTQQKPERGMPKADFVTSLVLLAFSVAVILLSVELPRLEHRDINPWTTPGIVPGAIGAVIGLMSLALLGRSLRQGGFRLGITRERIKEGASHPQVRRASVTILFCLLYAFGMIGFLPYPVATFLFVFVFVVLFEYDRSVSAQGQGKMFLKAFIEAVLVSAAVSSLFYYVFLVRLP